MAPFSLFVIFAKARTQGHGSVVALAPRFRGMTFYPTLAETDEEAEARRHRVVSSQHFIERALATGTVTDIDFSQFDLVQPLPRLTTNGEQGSLDKFAQWGSGTTLHQLAMERFGAPGSELDFVMTEGLVPALERRGLTGIDYAGNTLREVLTEY
jgi:hypothetical protein